MAVDGEDPGGLVQGGGQPAPRVPCQRVPHAQLVEHADDHASHVVARPVRAREGLEEKIDASLLVAGIQGCERLAEIGHRRLRAVAHRRLEADPRRQAVGGEAAWDARENGQRLVRLAAVPQDPRQRHRGVGASGLELVRAPERLFVPALDQCVGHGRQQRVEELLHRARRLSADELGRDLPVTERLDGRDALNPECPRQARVGVDVDFGQLDLAGAGIDGALDHRPKLPTRSAPFRPEVNDHRQGERAVKDRCLEGAFGDVHVVDGSDAVSLGNLTFTSISPTTPAAGSSTILVDDLVVRFDEVVAVGGVSFAVRPGESFGLLGPNGAGKTTTVRVLATLLRATEGRALVAGYDVRRNGLEVRASIGYIPQALSADGALTARENLEFYARVTSVPRQVRKERIAEAVEAMEIGGWLDRLARTLSGGMLRRLEIATALLNRPRVLLLDEPTVGLDPNARRVVWDRLHALREKGGTTILVTTHLMEEAERHCDRLAIMDHGQLVAQGTPGDLIAGHDASSIEDVFVAVTGRTIEEGGSFRDVRRQRRIAGRLG